jgi:hypothetical protein
MLNEVYPMCSVDDLDYFAGEHNWQDPVAVWDVFHTFWNVARKAEGL